MGRKAKYSFETKLNVVLRYLAGETSMEAESSLLGASPATISAWARNYKALGEEGLKTSPTNQRYSVELKLMAVSDYITGKGSLNTICEKYGIRSRSQLQSWIMKYNSHEKLKSSGTGGRKIMTNGRKTTYEERIEIIEYCIEHNHNYNETAEKYKVSYQQVYTWMKKFQAKGPDGLVDRRGRTKPEEEMSELERLRAENRILKAEKKQQQMEIDFLKKLEEIERRWG